MRTSSAILRGLKPAHAIGLLVVVTILVLSPVLLAGYLRLDDYSHLHDNPHLRSSSGLWALWTRPYFSLYIPITYSVWWGAARIVSIADGAWLFHTVNLLVHCGNAGLVFVLVRGWVRSCEPKAASDETPVALLAALVFAVHPVQVETVAWISELKGGLAAGFGLFGLWWHFRARRMPSGLCFLAAMLCKPSAIVFPGIVFVVNRALLAMDLRKSAAMPALYAALLAPLVFVTKHLQSDAELDFVPSVAQRLLVAGDALTFYIGKTVLPYPLALDYGRTPQFVLDGPAWRLGMPAVLALVVLAWAVASLARRRRSLVVCGGNIAVLGALPVSGLVPFGFQEFSTVADHYLYVPMFGVALMVAGILVHLRHAAQSRRIAAVGLMALAGLSFQQARCWRSTESLFTHTLQVNPRSYLAAHAIGEEHLHAHRLDQAIEWATRTLAIRPDFVKAQIHLGLAWSQKGQLDRAIEVYTSALARGPSTVGARAKPVASLHNNLGMALLQTGDEASAVAHFRQAVAIFPRSMNAHLNLARLAMANQRYQEARLELETVLSFDPSSAQIRQALEQAQRLAAPAAKRDMQ
jgi:Flp pilus assembly protein TadD